MEAKNILLNNLEITKEIKEETRKYIETNDNKNILTQNLQDEEKAILRGKFLTIQSHLKKQEKSQINNLTLHLKQLEKEEEKKQTYWKEKIINIRAEINEEKIAKMNKTKSWLFEKTNKIDKPLARLIKEKRGRRFKPIKLEMKKEKLQLTPLKYKGS